MKVYKSTAEKPRRLEAYAPIFFPLIFIFFNTGFEHSYPMLEFLGDPNIALLTGVILSIFSGRRLDSFCIFISFLFLLKHNYKFIIWHVANNKYRFFVFLYMNDQSYPEFTGLELSPRKVDYLKFILEKGGTVKTTEISSGLQVDPSTTSKTLNELASAGYLNHVPYKGVDLTEMGKAYTQFLVRRHRILSLLLTHYGLSSKEACDEVSRFEAFVSRDAVNKICNSMGHPMFGVCGEISHEKCLHEENHHSVPK
ncbi:iron (metal) dependent repressor, DtxR family [Methanosarcina thermophila]|jgi:DtxR family Mn-dependent transcriptional regulator|uniref:Iron (Metal) dependent repressor, DtxR family n=4 Tax=Methanosarcina thermophila TaxID=2210 RepID=A0A1I6ZHI0_METTE|nr:putative zinc-dependent repressor ZntR, DtxR superfamily [Methanosarcina thermophila CHTI-55]SFT62136.1 iron (metal) dependent repressor, DtxR family [Methanosarcina thermophila]